MDTVHKLEVLKDTYSDEVELDRVLGKLLDATLSQYRLRLKRYDRGLLEIFERFQMMREKLQVAKYSFHWQDAAGQLRKRWDNAAHHPEVPIPPHHVHDGAEANVLPHAPISAEEVLAIITAESPG